MRKVVFTKSASFVLFCGVKVISNKANFRIPKMIYLDFSPRSDFCLRASSMHLIDKCNPYSVAPKWFDCRNDPNFERLCNELTISSDKKHYSWAKFDFDI